MDANAWEGNVSGEPDERLSEADLPEFDVKVTPAR